MSLADFLDRILPGFLNDPKWRVVARIVAVLFGFAFGAFIVFQVLFLYRVLPHGGIW